MVGSDYLCDHNVIIYRVYTVAITRITCSLFYIFFCVVLVYYPQYPWIPFWYVFVGYFWYFVSWSSLPSSYVCIFSLIAWSSMKSNEKNHNFYSVRSMSLGWFCYTWKSWPWAMFCFHICLAIGHSAINLNCGSTTSLEWLVGKTSIFVRNQTAKQEWVWLIKDPSSGIVRGKAPIPRTAWTNAEAMTSH